MTTLLDHPTDTAHPVLVGMAEIEDVLDRMLATTTTDTTTDTTALTGGHAAAVRRLERIARRIEALKLKLLAAADRAGTAAEAGFTDTTAWAPGRPPPPAPPQPARSPWPPSWPPDTTPPRQRSRRGWSPPSTPP